MTTDELFYFVKTYELRSYAEAAKAINISYSGLRKSLGKLEEEFSQPLFVSGGSGLQPTVFGEDLYNSAVKILQIVRGLHSIENEKNLNSYSVNIQGYMRISIFMGEAIKEFFLSRGLPEPEIHFMPYYMKINSSDVLQYDMTLAHPDFPQFLSSTYTAKTFKIKTDLVMSSHSPLYDKETITWEDLRGMSFISGDLRTINLLKAKCLEHGFYPTISTITRDVSLTLDGVSATDQLVFVSQASIQQLLHNYNNLRVVPMPDAIEYNWYAITPKHGPKKQISDELADYLVTYFRDELYLKA